MVEALLASGNPGKLAELRALLPDWRVEPLEEEGPEETGESYRANALIKARFARARAGPGVLALGEDSGIECDALGGGPGLYSARFAGGRPEADVLLEVLVGASERGARMVCELVCITPQGEEHYARGTLEGTIALRRQGSSGFGYDPIFIPAGSEQTVAELGERWKLAHSHRAQAAHALAEELDVYSTGR